jgi:gentisate 1,2-dioxygenase
MAWIDGLDIPLVDQLDAGFFEFGHEHLSTIATPARSINERLWGHPGVVPLAPPPRTSSPLMAYRWEHTDAALTEQLACAAEGYTVLVEDGHAAVRFVDPTTGRDALRTIRTQMHRILAGTTTATARVVGSAVWQVFSGTGEVRVGEQRYEVSTGDLFVVPSWAPLSISADSDLDAFQFSDEPVYIALGLERSEAGSRR